MEVVAILIMVVFLIVGTVMISAVENNKDNIRAEVVDGYVFYWDAKNKVWYTELLEKKWWDQKDLSFYYAVLANCLIIGYLSDSGKTDPHTGAAIEEVTFVPVQAIFYFMQDAVLFWNTAYLKRIESEINKSKSWKVYDEVVIENYRM